MNFSTLNADFSSPKCRPRKFDKVCARERKKGYPSKNGYFTDASFSMKTVADRHIHPAHDNEH